LIWITAVQFDDSGRENHESIRAVRWREAESRQQGEHMMAELVALVRAHTLVYVSDEAFERTAIVRVVDADPPYVRAWAQGKWTNDVLALPRFDG
jgi:hypothetical protein